MKKVLVVVQDGPFNTIRSSEAFRMSIGLTLSENHVSLLLVDDGVFNLLPLHAEKIGRPSIQTYLEYFPKVHLTLLADAEALAGRGIQSVPQGTKVIRHEEALSLISEADVVIPFR
jgi:sulfur relay (sulfurtransferase) DsrF/TusC family protein